MLPNGNPTVWRKLKWANTWYSYGDEETQVGEHMEWQMRPEFSTVNSDYIFRLYCHIFAYNGNSAIFDLYTEICIMQNYYTSNFITSLRWNVIPQ